MEQLEQIIEQSEIVEEEASKETTVQLATISTIESDGVTITLDGNDDATDKHYKANTGILFKVGDRVKVVKESGSYIVEYPVGVPNSNLMVPSGGTTGQVLSKASDDSYDFAWTTATNPLPSGGAKNALLIKDSAQSYDVAWGSVSDILPSGTAGQYLKKTSTGVEWGSAPSPSALVSGANSLTLSSQTLTPSSSSINFGTSLYPIKDIYLNGSMYFGTSTTAKLGFFGKSPIARQTVSSSATVSTLITALKNYGLFA